MYTLFCTHSTEKRIMTCRPSEMIEIVTDFVMPTAGSFERSINIRGIKDSEFSLRILRVLMADPAPRFLQSHCDFANYRRRSISFCETRRSFVESEYRRGNNN